MTKHIAKHMKAAVVAALLLTGTAFAPSAAQARTYVSLDFFAPAPPPPPVYYVPAYAPRPIYTPVVWHDAYWGPDGYWRHGYYEHGYYDHGHDGPHYYR